MCCGWRAAGVSTTVEPGRPGPFVCGSVILCVDSPQLMLCAAPNILVQLSTITYTYNKCTEVLNWRRHWLRRLRERKVYSPYSFFSIQWCRTLLANAHWVLWPLYSWGVHRTLTSCIITLFPVRFHRERAGSYFSVSLRDYIHDLYLHILCCD